MMSFEWREPVKISWTENGLTQIRSDELRLVELFLDNADCSESYEGTVYKWFTPSTQTRKV